MDTVTHAMTGLIFAAPFAVSHPVAAGFIALGSVLPDLDALSRIGGKLSFLRWHQTLSHSLLAMAAYAVVGVALVVLLSIEPWYAGFGLVAGAVLHVLLDLTNTYGLGLFAPFSDRRFCFEWVFFIDATFILVCVVCLIILGLDLTRSGLQNAAAIVGWFVLLVTGYSLVRVLLRRAAMRRVGYKSDSMIPSALWPWVWFGYRADHNAIQLIRVNLIRGVEMETLETFDDAYGFALAQSDAYRVMCRLSAGYRATECDSHNDETLIGCRDLRVRNFGGVFGNLEVTLDASGKLVREVLNV